MLEMHCFSPISPVPTDLFFSFKIWSQSFLFLEQEAFLSIPRLNLGFAEFAHKELSTFLHNMLIIFYYNYSVIHLLSSLPSTGFPGAATVSSWTSLSST